MSSHRRMMLAYGLAKRRAEAKARDDMDALADRFEACNEATLAELRALRQEVARANAIGHLLDDDCERPLWLN